MAWLDPVNLPSGKSRCCGLCGEPLQFVLRDYTELYFSWRVFPFPLTLEGSQRRTDLISFNKMKPVASLKHRSLLAFVDIRSLLACSSSIFNIRSTTAFLKLSLQNRCTF
ncbi:hypothetical protein SORBI_3007G124000 [Sorghum bicolor]|uniref:Uncharacterized protein n=1 Tax=Sorghum bicolor TaxID=4558 RepID=A0A1B6PHS2_SORBI|nr:hypothetical protein SORBI_3007G124000 [Sorghum bicolor]